MSVDLWIERVGRHAKVILVRLLGGLDWWRYGIERLSVLAREHGMALAVLPGEDRDDPRLAAASTLAQPELDTLLAFFAKAGAKICARCCVASPVTPAPRWNAKRPSRCRAWPISGARRRGRSRPSHDGRLVPGRAVVPIVF